jgi:AcrR family transcriptional regulator
VTTTRDRAKADRRAALLSAAARLFAERGFERVSLEDLGAAAGVSGPAIYRHFAGKQAVLAAILLDVSQGLLSGGRAVVAGAPDAATALGELVAFHLDFALTGPAVIRVQDRDLDRLTDDDRHTVQDLQRTYVQLWVDVLAQVHPDESAADLRTRALAAFGLMNSTPRSGNRASTEVTRRILEPMTLAALLA